MAEAIEAVERADLADAIRPMKWERNSAERDPNAFRGLRLSRTVGGSSGGDCWGGEARGFVSDEPPLSLDALDSVLRKFAPELGWQAYKRLAASIETKRETIHEYYGNYEVREIMTIPWSGLRDFLIAEGALAEPT
jgi:hypothetical protein